MVRPNSSKEHRAQLEDFLKRPAGRSTAQSAPAGTQTAEPTERPAEKPAETPPATRSEEPATQQRQSAPEELPEEKPEPKAEKKPSETPAAKPAERPAKKEAPVAKTTQEVEAGEGAGRGRDTGKKVVAGANALRARIASIVWLVAVICAAVLAVAALMVALDEPGQRDRQFITDLRQAIFVVQVFKDFTGKGAATKEALTNYGISAVDLPVVGKTLDRTIRL